VRKAISKNIDNHTCCQDSGDQDQDTACTVCITIDISRHLCLQYNTSRPTVIKPSDGHGSGRPAGRV